MSQNTDSVVGGNMSNFGGSGGINFGGSGGINQPITTSVGNSQAVLSGTAVHNAITTSVGNSQAMLSGAAIHNARIQLQNLNRYKHALSRKRDSHGRFLGSNSVELTQNGPESDPIPNCLLAADIKRVREICLYSDPVSSSMGKQKTKILNFPFNCTTT